MEGYLGKVRDSQVARYTFDRPALSPIVVVRTYESVLDILKRQNKFESDFERKLRVLTNNVKPDIALVRIFRLD